MAQDSSADTPMGNVFNTTMRDGRGGRENYGRPPRKIRIPLPKLLDKVAGWQIYWHCGLNKAGILEMHFIVRTPNASPRFPDPSQVVQIFGSVCDHVEREPKFVGTSAGWRNWVLRLTAKKSVVEPLLFGVTPACGCDPWLDPRSSREVYECLCEWLKLWNEAE